MSFNLVGIDRFILVVRINSLFNYSMNHYQILDPNNHNENVRKIGTLSLTATKSNEYNYYVLNEKLQLISVSALFVPENKQFVILLNKSIKFPESKILTVNEKILIYLNNSLLRFLEQVPLSSYQNLSYNNYEYDDLPS